MRWLAGQWRLLVTQYRGPSITLLVLLPIVFALDFVVRVLVVPDPSARSFKAPAEVRVRAPDNPQDVLKRLEAWIPPRPVVEVAPPVRELKLQGVFGPATERRAAMALTTPGASTERVRATVGQVVDGWTVERIEPAKVILRRGEEVKELSLFMRKERETP
jgi:hypothetical protein